MAAAALITLTVSACSGNEAPDSDKVTETRMDDVDVIDGTISDAMVDVDTIQQADATGEEEDVKADESEDKAGGDAEKPADETTETPAQ